MPKNPRNHIPTVKRYLRAGALDPSPTLATSIRAIKVRLARARRLDRRISPEETLLAHLAGE